MRGADCCTWSSAIHRMSSPRHKSITNVNWNCVLWRMLNFSLIFGHIHSCDFRRRHATHPLISIASTVVVGLKLQRPLATVNADTEYLFWLSSCQKWTFFLLRLFWLAEHVRRPSAASPYLRLENMQTWHSLSLSGLTRNPAETPDVRRFTHDK